eukprot:2659669-Alexandrium_andersonii.AAC.1
MALATASSSRAAPSVPRQMSPARLGRTTRKSPAHNCPQLPTTAHNCPQLHYAVSSRWRRF